MEHINLFCSNNLNIMAPLLWNWQLCMSSNFNAQAAAPGRQQQRKEATRNTILDAAVALYQEQGVAATTISEVITRSGIGRTTFYRYFKDQDEVLNEAVLRDFEQLIADFETQRFDHDDPAVQIVEDTCWFYRQIRTRPALNMLFTERDGNLRERLNASLEKFREVGMAYSRPTYELAHARGMLRDSVTLERYVEWDTFVLISMLTLKFPFMTNEFRLRDTLRDFLIPSLIDTNRSEPQQQASGGN